MFFSRQFAQRALYSTTFSPIRATRHRTFRTIRSSSAFQSHALFLSSPLSTSRRFLSDQIKQADSIPNAPADPVVNAMDSANQTVSASSDISNARALGEEGMGIEDVAPEVAEAVAASTGEAEAPRVTEDEVPREATEQPARQEGKAHTVYVGNLFFDVTEDDLKREFSKFGRVNGVKLIYDGRGLSRGFGYVDFEDPQNTAAAVQNLHSTMFEGRRMVVEFAQRRMRMYQPRRGPGGVRVNSPPTKTLYVGNMSFEMSDTDLNELFGDLHNVIDIRIAIDRRTGQPRGFAHADFLNVESAEKAKKVLEAKEVHGRRLRVDFSQPSATAK